MPKLPSLARWLLAPLLLLAAIAGGGTYLMHSVFDELDSYEEKKPVAPKPAPFSESGRCAPGAGPKMKFPSREEAQREVLTAWRAGDRARLEALASCDYLLARGQGLAGTYQHPEKVMGLVLELTRGKEWVRNGRAEGDFYRLPLEGDALGGELLFQHDEESQGWFFAGFATSDSATLERLQDGSYFLGDEEE